MSLITIYPRLYTSRSTDGNGVIVSKGDATVELLYGFLVNRTIPTTSWSFHKSVLETAIRLFGDFEQWLLDQNSNPRLIGFNEEFLEDTLNFIEGQPRAMSVQTWMELLHEDNSLIKAPDPSKFPSHRLSTRISTVKTLQNWCSRPGGIEDLLCTMHILFGQAKR